MADELSHRVPVQNVRVRRRRYNGATWLIVDNYYHELDLVTDAIWLATDGARSVAQIAQLLSDERGWRDLDEVAAGAIAAFVDNHLMQFNDSRGTLP